ncbi:MAG: helix-turn-helix transcriptional regulator [Dehalococcoidia bacterium]|nr:helix-turn-helix transcriptional regulator [Dehalococcoidia bacterium]
MIRSEPEYQEALRRLDQDKRVAAQQRDALGKAALSTEEVERGMQPLLSFHAQLEEEIDWYEKVRRREFPIIRRLTQLGQLLIALRIANGITQHELADRLGVSESVVSRDERNEYHGVSVERAQRILSVLNGRVTVELETPCPAEEDEDLLAVS